MSVVTVSFEDGVAVVAVSNPPVNTIDVPTLLAWMRKYRDLFGPMHWEPAPLLVKLAAEGRSLADWERGRG